MDKHKYTPRQQAMLSELRELYRAIYGENEGAYQEMLRILENARAERPKTMRRLDAQRLAKPDWYKDREMLGMQLYVGAFAGTLRGVKDKLDYIEHCGVNYLHLMPLLESPPERSDGGYAVSDFRRVQPELGTM